MKDETHPRGNDRTSGAPAAVCSPQSCVSILWRDSDRGSGDRPARACLVLCACIARVKTNRIDDGSKNGAPRHASSAEATASRTVFTRSEEHTSELQSLRHLVCRL